MADRIQHGALVAYRPTGALALSPGRFVVLLTLALGVALFLELGRMDVVSDNEGQRATPPLEMVRSVDWLVPTINGKVYLNKPPLLYWTIAGVYSATGVISEWTARLPNALVGFVLVLAVYLMFRREAGEGPARWAALATATAPYLIQDSRVAGLDVPLTLAVFVAVTLFRRATMASGTLLPMLGAGVAFGAAVLLKGPVPFLFLVAAWVALATLRGRDPERVVRWGVRLTVAAFVLQFVLLGMGALGVAVDFPVTLTVVSAGWLLLTLWHGGRPGLRSLFVLACVALVGIALAAPWAWAVLQRTPWHDLRPLLTSQVVERTYVASRINGGDPSYYLRALPVMLAPAGFLLPLHLSRRAWRVKPEAYRFALLMGWLSIALFSLVAGKEYKYILPAVPFLLVALGFHLDDFAGETLRGWTAAWARYWLKGVAILLPVLAVGGAIYLSVEEPRPLLIVEAWIAAVGVVALTVYGSKRPDWRLGLVFVMALMVITVGLIGRGYHYTERNSPKALAELAGRLRESGYNFEAFRVSPAFAFHARQPIPEESDPERVLEKLAGEAPYFYLARKELLEQALPPERWPEGIHVLTDTYTSKKLVVLGNRPLPTPRLLSAEETGRR